jgi:DNA helicase-2/ATP-dependent DNA helicase PcrA
VIPHIKATKEESIEEERRLFYVAITRAKRGLHILFVGNRNKGQIKSRYIDECIGKTKC